MESPAGTPSPRLVFGGTSAAIVASTAALVLVPATVRSMMSSQFLPHVYCYLYDKQLIALHMSADALIWLSYVTIALTLTYMVRRARREIPFSWLFLAFGTFIIACGFTHFMEIVVLWKPLYWLAGDVKLLTALASVVTAIALPSVVPQILAMVRAAHVSEDRRIRLASANEDLQHLSANLLSAQDGERRRIARELHDGIGQYLAAIKMSFDVAISEDPRLDGRRGPLQDCRQLLERCTSEVRTMSHLLHPPLLEEMGLASAVPWYVEGFTERSGVRVDLDMPCEFSRLSQSVEMVLFRVVQESLTNVHRHSGSKSATIRLLVHSDHVELTIQDQGKGLGGLVADPANTGVGIAGMRERVRELGGKFEIDSGSQGTRVTISLPLQKRTVECH
jgi:signal transduction histidine kinase